AAPFWQCPRDFQPSQNDALGSEAAGKGAFARPAPWNGMGFAMTALWLIIVCGLLAIAYGVWAIWSVMQADPGSAKMQEISAAVREGAQAYLKRQYTTIAIVGVVIFLVVGYFLGW